MGETQKNAILLSVGSILSSIFLAPNNFFAMVGVASTLALSGLAYFIKQGWVESGSNEWLLIIENGLLKKAGVGLKTFKWFNQTAVTFPSTIQGVNFQANQVTKENFGIQIEGIVFWAVHRDQDGPFKCYKYTQGSDANENVQQVTESIVRSYISNTNLMDVLRKRIELREEVKKTLQKQLFGWGIWPETVEITEVRICSGTLFKDMQTEFRYKHKQLAINSKQQSNQILQEEQAKYNLQKSRFTKDRETKANEHYYEQEIKRQNFESKFKEENRKIEQQNQEYEQELALVRAERSNAYNLLQNKNLLELGQLRNDFEQEEKQKWEEVYDKMNSKNIEKMEIEQTLKFYQNTYQLEGFKVNQYIGPEGLSNVSGLMPAVNMINQMNK